MRIVGEPLAWLAAWLARYLARSVLVHGAAPETPPALLPSTLLRGDVLPVDGHGRIIAATDLG